MKYSIPVHNIIAIASLLTLSCVQFFLLYNTYELKDGHYYAAEKKIIRSEYLDAKQAVDSHRWKIDIKSVEGRGSIFTISIPMSL